MQQYSSAVSPMNLLADNGGRGWKVFERLKAIGMAVALRDTSSVLAAH